MFRRLLACVLVAAAIFVVDVVTPRGVAESGLYLLVVLLALRVQSPPVVIGLAAFCSMLTIVGFFLSADGASIAVSLANRGFGIAGIWIMVMISLLMHSSLTARGRLQRHIDQTNDQFRLARKIQQKLFPEGAPALAGFDIAGACLPADATGGDYFDFIPLSEGCLGIALGDVCGHGFGPALLMAEVHAFIRALALMYADVGQILTQTNRLVCEDTEDVQFITLFLGSLDPHKRTFVYASAGQQGFFLDAAGKITKLESTALPLGVNASEIVACAPSIHLDDNSLVVLITDGISEARAPDGGLFGMDRALAIVHAHRDQSALRLVELLCQAVQGFTQSGLQSDDITAVVVKSQPVAQAPGPTGGSSASMEAQGAEPDAARLTPLPDL